MVLREEVDEGWECCWAIVHVPVYEVQVVYSLGACLSRFELIGLVSLWYGFFVRCVFGFVVLSVFAIQTIYIFKMIKIVMFSKKLNHKNIEIAKRGWWEKMRIDNSLRTR